LARSGVSAVGDMAGILRALQQTDVAQVLHQFGVRARLRQHQELHGELGVHHAALAVLDVEAAGRHRVCGAHALAHADDFLRQRGRVAFGGDDGAAHGVEALAQRAAAEHEARTRHGLVLPGPGGVAAAPLLVVGEGLEAGHQQARIAVRAELGVDFEQVAFAGFHRQPVDELAHEGGVDLGGALVLVVEDEDDVEVAAVAQLLAAELAVADDAELRFLAVAPAQALPAPAGGQAQHAVGQRGEVVGHLLDRDAAFQVARQGAEGLGMVGAAQQVE